MIVTFVHQSSFVVELETHILLFDYFPAGDCGGISFGGKLPPISPEKRFFVFCSHHHKDHFSPDILQWMKEWPEITYILSKDCKVSRKELLHIGIGLHAQKRIRYVSPQHTYHIQDLMVETLRSNEEGVAFLVDVEGKCIFHAGDLHWWNTGEVHDINANTFGMSYRKELSRIQNRHMDVAFVVLDGRLKDGYALGMRYFLEHMDVDFVFPMHMWRDYSYIEKVKRIPELSRLRDKVVEIDRENIVFQIED